MAERRFNRELAAAIESVGPDLSVILPQQTDHEVDMAVDPGRIFNGCLRDLDRAEAVVAVVEDTDLVLGETLSVPIQQAKGLRSRDQTLYMSFL